MQAQSRGKVVQVCIQVAFHICSFADLAHPRNKGWHDLTCMADSHTLGKPSDASGQQLGTVG